MKATQELKHIERTIYDLDLLTETELESINARTRARLHSLGYCTSCEGKAPSPVSNVTYKGLPLVKSDEHICRKCYNERKKRADEALEYLAKVQRNQAEA